MTPEGAQIDSGTLTLTPQTPLPARPSGHLLHLSRGFHTPTNLGDARLYLNFSDTSGLVALKLNSFEPASQPARIDITSHLSEFNTLTIHLASTALGPPSVQLEIEEPPADS